MPRQIITRRSCSLRSCFSFLFFNVFITVKMYKLDDTTRSLFKHFHSRLLSSSTIINNFIKQWLLYQEEKIPIPVWMYHTLDIIHRYGFYQINSYQYIVHGQAVFWQIASCVCYPVALLCHSHWALTVVNLHLINKKLGTCCSACNLIFNVFIVFISVISNMRENEVGQTSEQWKEDKGRRKKEKGEEMGEGGEGACIHWHSYR